MYSTISYLLICYIILICLPSLYYSQCWDNKSQEHGVVYQLNWLFLNISFSPERLTSKLHNNQSVDQIVIVMYWYGIYRRDKNITIILIITPVYQHYILPFCSYSAFGFSARDDDCGDNLLRYIDRQPPLYITVAICNINKYYYQGALVENG